MDIVMIGAGMVAQTHVLALRDNAVGARLVGVLGRDAERTRAFSAGASETLCYDVAALAALGTGADGAILITPPDARLEYAQGLAAAGVPTLMEKPVERTLGAARGIVDLYAQADVPLAFCFQHRTRKAAQMLKAWLDAGDLGDVVHVEMRVPWWREQAYYDAPGRGTYARDGGGVMINQAIHTLDLGLWLAGPVAVLQAMMRTSPLHQMEAEDIAAALMTFCSGATGVLSATTTAYPGEAESITVTTTKARAHLEGDSLRIDWLTGEREDLSPEGASDTGGGADPMAFTHAWHQSILEDFVTSVAEGRSPIAPPAEALHVHAVIDAMERAARSGTTVEVVQ
ncbi:Gfo/Idh/MocA family oxidoreductase [Tateyamaria sp. ANG-S1]|uniref:Gfo/Idh/MocA family protein n=1 Tax=Tateyamaria sp. ANG-S1 TaxID=1577905 RepID=UPI00057E2723|nr:Gfo/Idh/MocA family oxidoreductase [Tateyamaria sp. ANG-S1]KIC49572.1 oxidoreductase [Tateyamaria sp. ANG-S1]